MRDDHLAVLRAAHVLELSEYLGQPANKLRETLRLYLRLLDQMGYSLVRKEDATPAAIVDHLEPAAIDHDRLYGAVEGAILDVTAQRLAGLSTGQRISDQAEVRAIVKAVEDLMAGVRAET